MSSFNKVILIGNLTRDPELKSFQSGGSVCNFTLAVNREWKNQQGDKQKEVGFFDCKAFGKTGDLIAQYLEKGRPVLVEGRLTQETWEKDGQKRSAVRVVVERTSFLPGGNRTAETQDDQEQEGILF